MEIREFIKEQILLFDGAMGTYFSASERGMCEIANLEKPHVIRDIHKSYISAGAKAIKTNTFGANRESLGCDHQFLTRIIKSGWELAKEAAGGESFVFADIGPVPSKGEAFLAYKELADIFLDLAAENFLFETFPNTDCLREVSEYIKDRRGDAFILAQFAINPEGYSRNGVSGEKMFYEISQVTAIDALGFNCVSGPKHLCQFIQKLDLYGKTVSVMPNAGYPTVINNRTFFDSGADYFSKWILEAVELGVSIVGGCCGTTPEFIRQTSERLKGAVKGTPQKTEVRIKAVREPNHFLIDKINRGEKIIAVEIDPPKDTNIDAFMEGARSLKDAGIDAITIADCPIARARADSSILACKIKREIGIETIPHLTCRDRNINATKALLLGLSIEGVKNVLVVTGDPIPSAQRDEVRSIYNFNSVNLASYISSLNESVFKTPFLICGALNVNARNFDSQLKHGEKKIKSGVSMLFTQPILSSEAIENLRKARERLEAKIIGGIMPVISHKNALFMNNEIGGISISPEIVKMYENLDRGQAEALAITLSFNTAEEIFPFVDGYYIMTPFNRVALVKAIVEGIKKL